MKSFSATVSERVAQYKKRLNATFKESAKDLVKEVTLPTTQGGKIRVDTGFLRSSLTASTSAMPLIQADARPTEGQTYQPDDGAIEAVIIGAQLGQTLYFGFVASYARPREYKDGFVRSAAQNWQSIVSRNAEKAIRAFP